MNVNTGILGRFDADLANHISDAMHGLSNPTVNSILSPGKFCLAGGAIRSYYDSSKINDLDIYVLEDDTWETMLALAKSLEDHDIDELDFSKPPRDPNKIDRVRCGVYKYPYKHIDHISFDNLEPRIEFLRTRYFPDYSDARRQKLLPPINELKESDFITATTVSEIIEGFDFICCMSGVEFTIETKTDLGLGFSVNSNTAYGRQLNFTLYKQHPLFLTCIAKKDLRVTPVVNMQKCGVAYKRLQKYFSYGYKLTRDEDFKILEYCRRDAFLTGMDLSNLQYDG
jgi:hypothetical protein